MNQTNKIFLSLVLLFLWLADDLCAQSFPRAPRLPNQSILRSGDVQTSSGARVGTSSQFNRNSQRGLHGDELIGGQGRDNQARESAMRRRSRVMGLQGFSQFLKRRQTPGHGAARTSSPSGYRRGAARSSNSAALGLGAARSSARAIGRQGSIKSMGGQNSRTSAVYPIQGSRPASSLRQPRSLQASPLQSQKPKSLPRASFTSHLNQTWQNLRSSLRDLFQGGSHKAQPSSTNNRR